MKHPLHWDVRVIRAPTQRRQPIPGRRFFIPKKGPHWLPFTTPTPLTRQITAALKVLRTARFDNDDVAICIAERRLDRLLDRYAAKPKERQ